MWVIFLISAMTIGFTALVFIRIGYMIYLSMKRKNKEFELEEELYNKAKKQIKGE